MAKIKVRLNYTGVRELLRGTEMKSYLESQARKIASKAGDGCEVYVAPTRAVAEVRTTSEKGNENNKLIKAMR